MSSTITAARQHLKTLLETTFTATATQVVTGNPKSFENVNVVALLGITAASEDFALLGSNAPDDERYAIQLRIKCHDAGSNNGDTTDAAGWAIYDTIRTAVRSDPTLGGVLIFPARTNTPRSDGAFQPDDATGWAIFIDFTIDCFGRAT